VVSAYEHLVSAYEGLVSAYEGLVSAYEHLVSAYENGGSLDGDDVSGDDRGGSRHAPRVARGHATVSAHQERVVVDVHLAAVDDRGPSVESAYFGS
jgi:hypothetical protein